ncbi:MAG: hypothetical protein GF350_05690 [Chitinivibrionales bacterium]|nr:hypothetical protein [Chitinivibrionales bacterium]
MYLFNKYPHPDNFSYLARDTKKKKLFAGHHECTLTVAGSFNDIYHITASVQGTDHRYFSRSGLTPLDRCMSGKNAPHSSLSVRGDGELRLKNSAGKTILQSLPQKAFGVCGNEWIFCFSLTSKMQFYGMGERSTHFEKSNSSHVFWNIDAWSDHDMRIIRKDHYDPDYISVPWVVIKQGNEYAGILIDSPFCSYISLGHAENIIGNSGTQKQGDRFMYFSAENGTPSLYVLYGASCSDLVAGFQNLTGRVPRPPLWALGYHQSKWGYKSMDDLTRLADNFERNGIPVDGLWLDIEYMDGYRVFTFDKKHFPSPKKNIARIQERGYRVVPILDPGIKRERGYETYDTGRGADIFCKNNEKNEFIGLVWPGKTVFPDFSLKKTHHWWAKNIEQFAQTGIRSAWLDMNDPATGTIKCTGMLFDKGKALHDAYHNQYALLMAQATRDGFHAAYPDERIFLLSRSGFTGSQKWTANWTGDNYSNYYHLRKSIATTLNLSLSGMPFTGPDVGGFGDNCTGQLMVDWIKAGFLFPFFRNHCHRSGSNQEPWVFTKMQCRIITRFIRLRYKLLPCIYNLFIRQERYGEPILRPLFYDFSDSRKLPLGGIDDQFMAGPSIMQAPFVDEGIVTRKAILPHSRWYRADTGEWMSGGKEILLRKNDDSTPVFFRDRSIIPMQAGTRKNNKNDLSNVELFICMDVHGAGTAEYSYFSDDGISVRYQDGAESIYFIHAHMRKKILRLKINTIRQRDSAVRFTPVTPDLLDKVVVTGDEKQVELTANRKTVRHFGRAVRWYYWK